MRQKLLACVLCFLALCGCVQQQATSIDSDIVSDPTHESSSLRTESEESMVENSASVAEVGVNGMTEKEILELFMRKVSEANDIYAWLFYDCFEDFDENSEGIYDTDNMSPEGFHWRPASRFETRQELYDYMGTVFRPMGVPGDLDWMFGEGMPGTDEEGNSVYTIIFKEIDGRLYVRDGGRWMEERPKLFDHAFETSAVAEETEGEIKVDVDVHSYTNGPRDRFRLLLENAHWVISRYPTHLY